MRPWRPQDIADGITGRNTRPDPNHAVFEDADLDALVADYDTGYLIDVPANDGRVQPVLWPMRVHRHGQDCGRA